MFSWTMHVVPGAILNASFEKGKQQNNLIEFKSFIIRYFYSKTIRHTLERKYNFSYTMVSHHLSDIPLYYTIFIEINNRFNFIE